jgi:hypothetical protein
MKKITILLFLLILLYSCKKEEIVPVKTIITPSSLSGTYYIVSFIADTYLNDGTSYHSENNYNPVYSRMTYSKLFNNGVESTDSIKILYEEDIDHDGVWVIGNTWMENVSFVIDGDYYYPSIFPMQKTKCEIEGDTLNLTEIVTGSTSYSVLKTKLVKE